MGEKLLGVVDIIKNVTSFCKVNMCSRKEMRIGYNFAPRFLIIRQNHSNCTYTRSLHTLVNSTSFTTSKTYQYFSLCLLRIKSSFLAKKATKKYIDYI
jgi:hypothetical protein